MSNGKRTNTMEWISVETALPENDQRVIVYATQTREEHGEMQTYHMVNTSKFINWKEKSGEVRCFFNTPGTQWTVTHWQPLPSPPEDPPCTP